MSDKSHVLCRYHMSGCCRLGAACAFSHDLAHDMPSMVCKYYLAGNCAYGSRCRYDHKRPDWGARGAAAGGGGGRGGAGGGGGSGRGGAGGGGGSGQGSPQQGQQGAPTHLYRRAWDAPDPHDPSFVPRSSSAVASQPLSQRSKSPEAGAGRGAGQDFRPAAGVGVAEGSCGGAGAELAEGEGEGQGVVESWEEAAGDEQAEEDGGSWGEGEERQEYEGAGYDQGDWQDGYYGEGGYTSEGYYGAEGYVEGTPKGPYGEGRDAGENRDQGEDDGSVRGEGGLTIIDDDLGLLEERRAVAGAAAAVGGGGWAGVVAGRGQGQGGPVDPSEVELCPQYALSGWCAAGEDCPLIHGDLCETCGRHRLHPYDSAAAARHVSDCTARHARLEARLRSSGVECGICLERVLDKPAPSERRFGLMACDHAFCLPCIRSWRETAGQQQQQQQRYQQQQDHQHDPDPARTCPLCRTLTHCVTPSAVWPGSAEEKARIVAAYRARLASIDCRHFAFGEGHCPFATSCFYRHAYKDGTLEEPVLRRAGNADGEVRVVRPVQLADWLVVRNVRGGGRGRG